MPLGFINCQQTNNLKHQGYCWRFQTHATNFAVEPRVTCQVFTPKLLFFLCYHRLTTFVLAGFILDEARALMSARFSYITCLLTSMNCLHVSRLMFRWVCHFCMVGALWRCSQHLRLHLLLRFYLLNVRLRSKGSCVLVYHFPMSHVLFHLFALFVYTCVSHDLSSYEIACCIAMFVYRAVSVVCSVCLLFVSSQVSSRETRVRLFRAWRDQPTRQGVS